ncbi:hypothetical protein KP509_15G015200 [Ceratopteris richardii]|uniref:TIR domain-containing protein n=1 Tax=Ceratopteris richardii TaxID=49495 RepID=A0A8T2T767_CERRI|nr:hypothetical protein KP509_15G015200 [Ceratopteris richardii]
MASYSVCISVGGEETLELNGCQTFRFSFGRRSESHIRSSRKAFCRHLYWRRLKGATAEETERWSKAIRDILSTTAFHYNSAKTFMWEMIQEVVAEVEASLERSRRTVLADVNDVFICHGPDTENNVVSVLRGMLASKRITCLNYDIDKGIGIDSCRMDIKLLKVHIILLSESLGSSRLCLDAVVEVMDLEGSKRRVLPVFYDVEPFVVRYQRVGSPLKLRPIQSRRNRGGQATLG